MRLLVAVLVGASTLAIALSFRRIPLVERVAGYLVLEEKTQTSEPPIRASRWIRGSPWIAGGGLVGVLAAQGDLFIAGPGRSLPGLMAAGCAAGWVLHSMHMSNLQERRIRRLRDELPVVVDALSLEVLSGESVESALHNVTGELQGVVSQELEWLLEISGTEGLGDALRVASHTTDSEDARRLYDVLAHAHAVGGRLSEALAELASDLRGSLEREVTAEGGRRAVAAYGPVLALMVPTALAFLLYPTLLGLRALSGAP
jgi:Flp pilus assembly protein TadB